MMGGTPWRYGVGVSVGGHTSTWQQPEHEQRQEAPVGHPRVHDLAETLKEFFLSRAGTHAYIIASIRAKLKQTLALTLTHTSV